tara:strand:+ start:440 stop:811 length:372 start_codon:yes stop_codon:yes gene_type:complete
MATKPISKFTVQESNNLKVSETYLSQLITCSADDTYVESSDWASGSTGPAKEVTIMLRTGDTTDVITIALKIAGSYGDGIAILASSLPLTIDRLLIDRIKIKTADGSGGGSGTDEVFSIMSQH